MQICGGLHEARAPQARRHGVRKKGRGSERGQAQSGLRSRD